MDTLTLDAKQKMEKAIEATRHEYSTIRTGRATPALLDHVRVDYYGSELPINQLATVTVPESRMLVITPWDKAALPKIERAILTSDLNLTPTNDGSLIRLELPSLTEERRKELGKLVHKRAEEGRVHIRNVRRDVNETLDKREKAKELSEDDVERGKKEVQKLTDEYIKKLDEVTEQKIAEIMEV
jgi:ribosome recycling factor